MRAEFLSKRKSCRQEIVIVRKLSVECSFKCKLKLRAKCNSESEVDAN